MKGYKGKIKKNISIKLVGEAEKAFKELNIIVGEQRSNGITSSSGKIMNYSKFSIMYNI